MYAVKRAILEFAVLGVIGLALGFGVNAVRAKGSIKPTKNYFDVGVPVKLAENRPAKKAAGENAPGAKAAPAAGTNGQPGIETAAQPARSAGGSGDSLADAAMAEGRSGLLPGSDEKSRKHLKHEYQSIDFKDVAAIFDDPATRQGLNVFLDARNDEHFKEGHIPDAVQCDPYQVDRYLDDVLARTSGVEKVIVYCNGGDCEDSIFMCRELIAAGLPYESVYLFEGGWKEWTANGMPVASSE